MQRLLKRALIGGVTVANLGVMPTSVNVAAADTVPKNPKAWEKCFGIARAYKNDCSSSDLRHACANEAISDADPTEYVWVPVGTCEKIVGGSTGRRQKARKPKNAGTSCARARR